MENRTLERSVAAIFILIGAIAIHQLLKSHFPAQPTAAHGAGDWAAWLGAIGTTAAAIIALRIAGQQERTRRRIEVTQAGIVAARLAPKLEYVRAHLISLQFSLFPQNPNEPAKNSTKAFLESPPLVIEVTDLVALAGLDGNHAASLSYALGILESLRAHMAGYMSTTDRADAPLRLAVANDWVAKVVIAENRIGVVQRACELAAKIHAPEPTSEALYGPGWDSDDDF